MCWADDSTCGVQLGGPQEFYEKIAEKNKDI